MFFQILPHDVSFESLSQALYVYGLWPDGYPVQAVAVDEEGKVVRPATEEEIKEALRFQGCFGPATDDMVEAQWSWFTALSRPARCRDEVVRGLGIALHARGLGSWALEEYGSAGEVRNAWRGTSLEDYKGALVDWRGPVRTTKIKGFRADDVWSARRIMSPDVSGPADARAALSHRFAAWRGLVQKAPDLYEVGIQHAYLNGLLYTEPVTGGLGFVMSPGPPTGGLRIRRPLPLW